MASSALDTKLRRRHEENADEERKLMNRKIGNGWGERKGEEENDEEGEEGVTELREEEDGELDDGEE